MISRIWHGYTTAENADRYQEVLLTRVLPEIEAMGIEGLDGIHVLRRSLEDEVEFVTIMWFDSLDDARAFVGDDHEAAHVPPAARRRSRSRRPKPCSRIYHPRVIPSAKSSTLPTPPPRWGENHPSGRRACSGKEPPSCARCWTEAFNPEPTGRYS